MACRSWIASSDAVCLPLWQRGLQASSNDFSNVSELLPAVGIWLHPSFPKLASLLWRSSPLFFGEALILTIACGHMSPTPAGFRCKLFRLKTCPSAFSMDSARLQALDFQHYPLALQHTHGQFTLSPSDLADGCLDSSTSDPVRIPSKSFI